MIYFLSKILREKIPIYRILLGLIVTFSLIFIDMSVMKVWDTNTGSLLNGFWSISYVKTFHISLWFAFITTWLLVFSSSKED